MSHPLQDELLLRLATPDRRAAALHSAGLVDGGLSLETLVDEVLAPAMRQVGLLWEAAVWTVTDEHLATATAEAALTGAADRTAPPPPKGDVVVTCVEGDWHSLPARMVAEVLLSHGWAVRFLGASQPTTLLVDYVNRHRPDAVLLSCAVPMALPALVRAVAAVRALDLPVLVGGHALTPLRAAAVGADGYASSAAGAALLLDPPTRRSLAGTAMDLLPICTARQSQIGAWADRAMVELGTLMPVVRTFSEDVRARTEADLVHVLDTACIGLLLGDPRLVEEQCDWLARVLAARGVPVAALAHGLAALRASRPAGRDMDDVAAVLEREHLRLTCPTG